MWMHPSSNKCCADSARKYATRSSLSDFLAIKWSLSPSQAICTLQHDESLGSSAALCTPRALSDSLLAGCCQIGLTSSPTITGSQPTQQSSRTIYPKLTIGEAYLAAGHVVSCQDVCRVASHKACTDTGTKSRTVHANKRSAVWRPRARHRGACGGSMLSCQDCIVWAWQMQRRLEKGQQHIPLTMLYVAGRGMTTTSTQSTCTSEQLYC